jgi:hypothetical protein
LVIALIPLSIMVAVLRYQLLDIRLVLSRSVLYVLLTAAVVGTYLLIVAVSDAVLRTGLGLGPRTGHAPIAVAFNPVRVWLQRKVERVIYGARRDPAEAIAAVGAWLGEVGGADSAGLPGVLQALATVMRFPWATVVVKGVESPPAETRRPAATQRHCARAARSSANLSSGCDRERPGLIPARRRSWTWSARRLRRPSRRLRSLSSFVRPRVPWRPS